MEEIKIWIGEHGKWLFLAGGGILILVVAFFLFGHSNNTEQAALPTNANASSATSSQSGSFSHANSSSELASNDTASKATSVASMSESSSNQGAFADVQGAVVRPGLYPVGATTRVADLVIQAGGLTAKADRSQINLAQKVSDQQVISVPEKGAPNTAGVGATNATSTTAASGSSPVGTSRSGSPTGGASNKAKINLNSADVSQLQQLSGIGEKKAQKIIDYRSSHGPFKSVNDLQNVAGFGAKTVEKYQDQLGV